MAETPPKLMIMLDTLLDTRLGTLLHLNPQCLSDFFIKQYWKRLTDDFEYLTQGLISQETYLETYKNRDHTILKKSKMTNLITFLFNICLESFVNQKDYPDAKKPILVVNSAPYSLSPTESRAIISCLKYYIGDEFDLFITYKELKELTPTEFKNHWDGLILYDFNEWCELHSEEILKVINPRALIFTPALYLSHKFDQDELNKKAPNITNHFKAIEFAFMERFNLTYMDIRYFSVFNDFSKDP